MKYFFDKIQQVTKRYTIMDIGILKICLLSMGILLGIYFYASLESLRWLFWVLFVLSWLFIVLKTFGVYWNQSDDK